MNKKTSSRSSGSRPKSSAKSSQAASSKRIPFEVWIWLFAILWVSAWIAGSRWWWQQSADAFSVPKNPSAEESPPTQSREKSDVPREDTKASTKTAPRTLNVRSLPDRFPRNTYLPKKQEGQASGSIDLSTFFPKVDLVKVHDDRCWWESEHDRDDTENDHLMHRNMELPFRRLVELVERADGTLKVQDAYREGSGIHAARSLHKEGRAIDLTSEGISLEHLAKLCWAAGFDWVYYEAPEGGGWHIHASVQRDG